MELRSQKSDIKKGVIVIGFTVLTEMNLGPSRAQNKTILVSVLICQSETPTA